MNNLGVGIEIDWVVELDVQVVGKCLQKFRGVRLHDLLGDRNGLNILVREMCKLENITGFSRSFNM